MDWNELKTKAESVLVKRNLPEEYHRRFKKECYEIIKQGANALWVEFHENKKKWETNPNGLVFPWLLDMTPVDPVAGTDKLKVESSDGIMADSIVIQLSNGKEICVSEHTLIKTNRGYIKASELTIDHTIPE